MEQYIPKAAVVAEIERRKKELIELSNDFENRWACASLDNILSFLDTLKVKEVNLEKVIEEYFKGWTDDYDNGGAACHYQYVQVQDCKAIAKRFFELGLKAQKVE